MLYAYLRIISLYQLYSHLLSRLLFLLSFVLKKNRLKIRPFAVSIESYKGCNLQCPGCELGANILNRKNGGISLNDYKMVINQLPKTVFHINLHFQGEPILNKHLPEMIAYAVNKNLFVSFSTNALLLTKDLTNEIISSGLQHIIISVDGYNQQTYEKYRKGGNFDTLIDNVNYLIKRKKQLHKQYPLVEMQTIVFSHNETHLDEIKKLAKNLKFDTLTFKSAYVIDLESVPEYLPKNKKYLRYKYNNENGLQLIRKRNHRCFRFYTNPVITHDLDVLPCCFDKNSNFVMGNLKSQTFSEIICGNNYKKFEKMLIENKKSIKMCNNCAS